MSVMRVFVEKKQEFAVEAGGVLSGINTALGAVGATGLRLFDRYDLEGVSPEDFTRARGAILSEPQIDLTYDEIPADAGDVIFAVELLPGQFDQRADSAAQCIQIMTQKDRPTVRNARVYAFSGDISSENIARIKAYLINPVETREASLELPERLDEDYPAPPDTPFVTGFKDLNDDGLAALISDWGLAMDIDDIRFCRDYFKSENRDPSETELRVIDTYWSDHCRHTTFNTRLEDITIEPQYIKEVFGEYKGIRERLYPNGNRPITLMDLATAAAKIQKKDGVLKNLDESEEINACSVKIKADVNGRDEDYLLMFKNETHNHPTEIEPFGGASTCLGGAIRDPLSGRSFVYQAMRLTGSGNPLADMSETLRGKLPQRKLMTTAAAGYSSYGNQIGLPTGFLAEVHHPGFVAKRMECGAVVGAAPAGNVRREKPAAGDVVILLGGKTGRDGCGGATGSSKAHSEDSLTECGAEVQKGNAPEERKIQRLFRNPEASGMIKRCNDFGAGGVSVAIGELADGLKINLDMVPKKYEGLNGTELAISESQERMAVVVSKEDAARFAELAETENLDSTIVAEVTDDNRLVMSWRGKTIVDLKRSFIDSSGAPKTARAHIPAEVQTASGKEHSGGLRESLLNLATDLNICSQKGMIEMFDPSVGANTVILPFGGRFQNTPAQSMAAKIPVLGGVTDTASVMAYGYDPYTASESPFKGAYYAVLSSVAKLIAAGGKRANTYLSFQEFFEKLRDEPNRWGKPLSALLGALKAQMDLSVAAIGGKDSMSGSFEELDVPPTLISFAICTAKASRIISPEFKSAGNNIYYVSPAKDENSLMTKQSLLESFDEVERAIDRGDVVSAWALGRGGIAEAVMKMSFGNRIGAKIDACESFFESACGGFILESEKPLEGFTLIGKTDADYAISYAGERVELAEIESAWESVLSPLFPFRLDKNSPVPAFSFDTEKRVSPAVKVARPKVLVPAFAGTNCEYDTISAFQAAGAECETFIVRNRSASDIEWSVSEFEKMIRRSNIIAIPGGFSGGDEPAGSAKFITAFFRNPRVADAVMDLLKNRDGLMIGICNGFQALIKLGLVPYGDIREMQSDAPTLTYNRIGRHESKMVRTRIASNLSPWLMYHKPGDIHLLPVSHGEGRFVASEAAIAEMMANGQIAAQYVDLDGAPSMDTEFNPNGSACAIESITSPCGRILGKMAHSERVGKDIYKNVPGDKFQHIFKGAVDYFSK